MNHDIELPAAIALAAGPFTPEDVLSRRRAGGLHEARILGAFLYKSLTGQTDERVGILLGRTTITPWRRYLEQMDLLQCIAWDRYLADLCEVLEAPIQKVEDLVLVETGKRSHGNPSLVSDDPALNR